MIAVIQCAGRKTPTAGFLKTKDGRPVCFVAAPDQAPVSATVYARPDDPSDSGPTWREVLLHYNHAQENPLGLLPAVDLYQNPIYRRLAHHVGRENLFILSAGWGLIPASFLTPDYDITFKPKKEDAHKRRKRSDVYQDFCMLPPDTAAPVVFFGSSEYVPLFVSLTAAIKAPKYLFYRSAIRPEVPGCTAISFPTRRRTNWQYECAQAYIDGKLDIVPRP